MIMIICVEAGWNHTTAFLTDMDTMLMSSYGFSVLGWVLMLEMVCTTSMPLTTRPNTVCLLSSQGVGTTVTKNWDPLVLGPELAIDKVPAYT